MNLKKKKKKNTRERKPLASVTSNSVSFALSAGGRLGGLHGVSIPRSFFVGRGSWHQKIQTKHSNPTERSPAKIKSLQTKNSLFMFCKPCLGVSGQKQHCHFWCLGGGWIRGGSKANPKELAFLWSQVPYGFGFVEELKGWSFIKLLRLDPQPCAS